MIMEKWSQEHGKLLQHIIEFNQYKVCVEVGVAFGTTTLYLCEGAKKHGGHIFGFDIWDVHGQNRQFKQISSKEDVENYLRSRNLYNFSLEKIDTKSEKFKERIKELGIIDFAFIDGCHSYIGLKNDFDVIYPNLSKFGTIVFHDTLKIDGCREFVLDLRTKYYDGTFDIIDFPWGNLERRVGISILVKRSYPICDIKIDEECGNVSGIESIYQREKEWYLRETNGQKSIS